MSSIPPKPPTPPDAMAMELHHMKMSHITHIPSPEPKSDLQAMVPSRPAPTPPGHHRTFSVGSAVSVTARSRPRTPSLPATLAHPFTPTPPSRVAPAVLANIPIPSIPQSETPADGETKSLAPSTSTSRRRSSFSFFSRSSNDGSANRSSSQKSRTRNMLRKQRNRDQDEARRQSQMRSQVPQQPPQLPQPSPMPSIEGFGGADQRPDSIAMSLKFPEYDSRKYHGAPTASKTPHSVISNFSRPGYIAQSSSMGSLRGPSPALGASRSPPANGSAYGNAEAADPYARAQSMTNRGRESYASPVLLSSAGGNVSSPRRMRRRKDPTSFNILVIGAKGSGKTSFIEFLKISLALPDQKCIKGQSPVPDRPSAHSPFDSTYLETEFDGERVGLTLWDTNGLEKNIVDLQLREITSFIESKFEDTFAEEQKVVRSPGAKDTHIHCALLFIDPIRLHASAAYNAPKTHVNGAPMHVIDEELDLQAMKALSGKTTVIPIISKADTLTNAHMSALKRTVWSSIQAAKLDPLEALGLEEESDCESYETGNEEASSEDSSISDAQIPKMHSSPPVKIIGSTDGYHDDGSSLIDDLVDHSSPGLRSSPTTSPSVTMTAKVINAPNTALARTVSPLSANPITQPSNTSDDMYIPFSVLSPDPYTLPHILVRVFPWGEADPSNPQHCDYSRLRESLFVEWRSDLRLASREKWYENWRTSRLKQLPGSGRVRQAGSVTPAGVIPHGGRTVSGSRQKIVAPVNTNSNVEGLGLSFGRVTSPERKFIPGAPSNASAGFHGVHTRPTTSPAASPTTSAAITERVPSGGNGYAM